MAKFTAKLCKQKGDAGTVKKTDLRKKKTREYFKKNGWVKDRVRENIAYGALRTGEGYIVRHYIDYGVKSRSHRKNMINPKFTHTGIAHCDHKKYKKMLVVMFAESNAKASPDVNFNNIDQYLDRKAFDDIFSLDSRKKQEKKQKPPSKKPKTESKRKPKPDVKGAHEIEQEAFKT